VALPDNERLKAIAEAAVSSEEIASAAIFLVPSVGSALALAAAAGIEGPALDRLTEAVLDHNHPIARTVEEGYASFDVTPMAPGGPALRSHLPLMSPGAAAIVIGVLAVAHDQPVSASEKAELLQLAADAADAA
jgi:hypothetical protein